MSTDPKKKKNKAAETPASKNAGNNAGTPLSDAFNGLVLGEAEIIDITPQGTPPEKTWKERHGFTQQEEGDDVDTPAAYDRDYAEMTGGYVEADPIRDMARRHLPDDSPEIQTALELASNIDHMALVAATVVENTWRDKMADEDVDCMTTACLLLGAHNVQDIVDQFESKTIETIVQYSELIDALGVAIQGVPVPFNQFSAEARRIALASMIATMQAVTTGLDQGQAVGISPADFGKTAATIIMQSKTLAMIPPEYHERAARDADLKIVDRAADMLNEMGSKLGMPIRLRQIDDGSYTTDIGGAQSPKPPKTGGDLKL